MAEGSGHPRSAWWGWAWQGSTPPACGAAEKNEKSPSESITHGVAKQQSWLKCGKRLRTLVNGGYTAAGNHGCAHRGVLLAAQRTLGTLGGCYGSSPRAVPVHCVSAGRLRVSLCSTGVLGLKKPFEPLKQKCPLALHFIASAFQLFSQTFDFAPFLFSLTCFITVFFLDLLPGT